jgi:hypothetical protein
MSWTPDFFAVYGDWEEVHIRLSNSCIRWNGCCATLFWIAGRNSREWRVTSWFVLLTCLAYWLMVLHSGRWAAKCSTGKCLTLVRTQPSSDGRRLVDQYNDALFGWIDASHFAKQFAHYKYPCLTVLPLGVFPFHKCRRKQLIVNDGKSGYMRPTGIFPGALTVENFVAKNKFDLASRGRRP